MDQSFYNYTYAAVLALIGWFGKSIWDAINKLKEDLKSIEVDLPRNYVQKADIEARFDRIDQILERIFDKLEHKADRHCSGS